MFTDERNELQHRVIHIDRPYPWTMYQPLVDLDIGIIDTAGIEPYTDPWGTLTFDQVRYQNRTDNLLIASA